MEEQNNNSDSELNQAPPAKKFMTKRKWWIFGLLISVIVLYFIAMFAVTIVNKNSEAALLYPSYDKQPEKTDLTTVAYTVVDALREKYSAQEMPVHVGETAPYWHAENDDTLYVTYTDAPAVSLEIVFDDTNLLTSKEIKEDRAAIIATVNNSLKAQGFLPIDDSPYGKASDVWYYDSIVCVVDAADSDELSSPVNFQCGALYWYNTSSFSGYGIAQLLATAYKEAGNTVKKGDIFELESNDESTVSGYRKAIASLSSVRGDGGANLLFYKKGDDSWKFFAGTQVEISCQAYNTEDLRAAFKGDTCYDEKNNRESTVK